MCLRIALLNSITDEKCQNFIQIWKIISFLVPINEYYAQEALLVWSASVFNCSFFQIINNNYQRMKQTHWDYWDFIFHHYFIISIILQTKPEEQWNCAIYSLTCFASTWDSDLSSSDKAFTPIGCCSKKLLRIY